MTTNSIKQDFRSKSTGSEPASCQEQYYSQGGSVYAGTTEWNFSRSISRPTPTFEDYEEVFEQYDLNANEDILDVNALDPDQRVDDYPLSDIYGSYEDSSFSEEDLEKDSDTQEFDTGNRTSDPSISDYSSDYSSDMDSQLQWREGVEWTLKREYFTSQNLGPMPEHQITLSIDQKEWERLSEICEKFGMTIEDYAQCCLRKVHSVPFAGIENQQMWRRLLSIKDRMEQYENMLEFCSDGLRHNLFESEVAMRHWLQLHNDAINQIDMIFNLIGVMTKGNAL